MKKIIILTVIFATGCLTSYSQNNNRIKLSSWKASECVNQSDPYHLKQSITDSTYADNKLFITISFKENCCAKYRPVVNFKNDTLFIKPYRRYFGKICKCMCAYTMKLELSNVNCKIYYVMFKNEEIEHKNFK